MIGIACLVKVLMPFWGTNALLGYLAGKTLPAPLERQMMLSRACRLRIHMGFALPPCGVGIWDAWDTRMQGL